MNSLEKKLAEYRARKIEQNSTNYKKNLLFSSNNDQEELKKKLIEEPQCDIKEEHFTVSTGESNVDDNISCCSYMDIVYYTLCVMLWATLWAIFIKLQFGTVYLIVSIIIGIYLNTRTRPKYIGEVSAYSVFNKNCESIDGTLKAEQFERELRYGPAAVH